MIQMLLLMMLVTLLVDVTINSTSKSAACITCTNDCEENVYRLEIIIHTDLCEI